MPTQTPGLFLVCRKLFLVFVLGLGLVPWMVPVCQRIQASLLGVMAKTALAFPWTHLDIARTFLFLIFLFLFLPFRPF